MIRLILIILFISNCNLMRKTSEYLVNRGNDLTDIVTVTINANSYGAKAYVGPVGLGLHAESILSRKCLVHKRCYRGNIPFPFANGVPNYEIGNRNGLSLWENASQTVGFSYWEYAEQIESGVDSRDKSFKYDFSTRKFKFPISQWTRIGITGGFLFGGRVEVNPAEALDFLLGFVGIDIYKDDNYFYFYKPSDKMYDILRYDIVDEFKILFEKENLEVGVYKDEYQNTFLHSAVSRKSIKIVKYLVEEKKADINKISTLEWSPMGYLDWCNDVKPTQESYKSCIELLNYMEFIGASYIHAGSLRNHSEEMINAIQNDNTDFIEKYLSTKNPNARFNKDGKICLKCVVFPSLVEIKGIPNEGGEYFESDTSKYGGMTLLQLAIYYNKPNVVKYLLQKGANPKQKNFRDHDSFFFAEEFNRPEILLLLNDSIGKKK